MAGEQQADAGAKPAWYTEPCTLGIDEAGRGPILGPMVYGCAFSAVSYKDKLAKLGFADSKQLSEVKRDHLYDVIMKNDNIGWYETVLSASDISTNMMRKDPYNLNSMSYDTAIGLIQRALDDGVHLVEAFVDTVGSAEKYEERLTKIFTGIKFTVRSKADSLYPIVSAASIVAKVSRDRALKDWEFQEDIEPSRKFGSGYPGDPFTKDWIKGNIEPTFGFPVLVRFSWQTSRTSLKENGAKRVRWECDDEEDDTPKLSFGGKGCAAESSAKGRHSYFRARKLQRMTAVF